MASILSLSLIFLYISSVTFTAAASLRHQHPTTKRTPFQDPEVLTSPSLIHQACRATRLPDSCESTLSNSPSLPANPTPTDFILAAISASAQNLKTAQSMAQSILDASSGDRNRSNAAGHCIEQFSYSDHRLARSAQVMPAGRLKDARAWTSAAQLDQYDCFSALKYVNGTKQVNDAMWFLISLTGLTSNALSMIAAYDRFGNDTAVWVPPQTERDGYWGDNAGQESGFNGGFPADLTPNAVVCKEGEGCHRTVQEAVNAAPEYGPGRFVIYIKEGVYQETVRIPFEKTNVVFLGDGMGKTVITRSLNAQMVGVTTYNTATVGVNGDGFMAKNLTIENTAGPDAHQAVAFRSDSDLSIVENVEFLGHQDTLYARSLRQFYKSCRIVGTVDFIFGNSAVVFQDCLILIQPRQLSPATGETNTVTAHGRTDPAQSTGFVFQNCVVNGTDDYMAFYYQKPNVHRNYLGRPWKEYSRTVFIHCYLEVLITAEGWLPWAGEFALQTLFYGEFESSGPGKNVTGRVGWSNQIPPEHVSIYSVQNFIQGRDWIPAAPDL